MPPKPKSKVVFRPFVSVLCCTYNRRPFFPAFFDAWNEQTYPKSRFEIVIVDDGTDPIGDLVAKHKGGLNVKYNRVEKKMTLGAKRNLSHTLIDEKTKIIVVGDDDDIPSHERIEHAVEMLENHSGALCAASSELYIYFKHNKELIQFGPYHVSNIDTGGGYGTRNAHGTAGTFAYRRELINISSFDNAKCLAEERGFLKDYTIPMIQLNPLKTILCVSHEHNTFDKRILLENPNPQFVKKSDKTVDMFVKNPKIRDFFLIELGPLLDAYKPGHPNMKPDVMKQLKMIELERNEAMKKQQEQQNNQQPTGIIFNIPGQEPKHVTLQEAVQILQEQQHSLEYLTQRTNELEAQCKKLQIELLNKTIIINKLSTPVSVPVHVDDNVIHFTI
jgi:glycosyltransferase involved in cell wall biosynthesis